MAKSVPTGARIRERRLALGRRQVAVAERAGISPSYLNLIEHGRRAIGGRLLTRIAEALDTDRAALSEDGDAPLVAALAAVGAGQRLSARAQAEAGELVRRYPDWARATVALARAVEARERRIGALSDRLAHDPGLSEAMHELLGAVSTVRATASILAQTPSLDPNWRGRFHANLDEDGRRLALAAEAVAGLLAAQPSEPEEGGGAFHPVDLASLDAIEDAAPGELPVLVASMVDGIADKAARMAAEAALLEAARDAARLPRAVVEAAREPDDLLAAADGDLPLVLRRMAARDPRRGLVVCDAAGAFLQRREAPGFPIPAQGAGCALWPLYAALTRPGQPVAARIEMPDGARWLAHAVTNSVGPLGFGAPPILRATMLVTRADGPEAALPVGTTCRVCPRLDCPARREPSLLVAGG